MDLLASESSGEDDQISFKINKNYAKSYEIWRKKEERQKLIDKYGDIDSSDSSSEEEEIRSTPQMDKDWLRAYAVVRFQQPRLYKKGEKFFNDVAEPVIKHKEKTTTLKDHERNFILKKGGVEDETKFPQNQGKSYFEEQEEIKKSFQDALKDSSDEETAGENDGLLVRKQKTEAEKKKEENEYLEWIKGERAELEDKEAAAELAPLRKYWNDPSLSEKERVLRDYILNNGYIDQEESEEEKGNDDDSASDFDAEEEFLDKAENYEHKYNFRHEEPGGDEIKSYPRVIETSVRTKDTRRADKRKRKMEKKRSEREERRDEIRLLQRLQREEKMEKLENLRKIADNPHLAYDLETDFDPDEHNKIMQKFFNEGYYGDTEDANKKPTFEYDAGVDDEPDDWWQTRLKEDNHNKEDEQIDYQDENHDDDEIYADDPNFVMDADYDPNKDYRIEKKKNKKSHKKVVQKLPLFDPTTKTFDEYMDEYLKDKIDKLPFTYREVVPNDFGLSAEEILKANEKELNAWVSVKKMSAYRCKQDELADKRKFMARSTNEEKKRNILPSLFEKPEKPSGDKDTQMKKKKKKKKLTTQETAPPLNELEETGNVITTQEEQMESHVNEEKSTRKAKKRKLTGDINTETETLGTVIDTSDKTETDISKRKKKNVKKHLSNNNITEITTTDSDTKQQMSQIKGSPKQIDKHVVNEKMCAINAVSPVITRKKKKKKKLKQGTVNEQQNVEEMVKKHKKKKVSISNFSSKIGLGKEAQMVDKRKIKQQLMKVMSASRLSKYGIGPNAVKKTGKKKKKKKQKVQV